MDCILRKLTLALDRKYDHRPSLGVISWSLANTSGSCLVYHELPVSTRIRVVLTYVFPVTSRYDQGCLRGGVQVIVIMVPR